MTPQLLLRQSRSVSLPQRAQPRRALRIRMQAIEPGKNSTSSTSSTSSPPPPRRPSTSFPARDAYDSARALALALAFTGVAGGGGVGSLANWLVESSSSFSSSSLLPLADARALSAFAIEGAQLAAVSLIASNAGSHFQFDFRDKRAISVGLAGGVAAVAAVGGVDFLLSTLSSLSSSLSSLSLSSLSLSSPSSSSSEAATATAVAASVLSEASGPFTRAALILASCILAPATEEIVFRGILLRGLLLGRRNKSGSGGEGGAFAVTSSVAASAAAFSASHLLVLASDGSRGEVAKELLLLFVLGGVLAAAAVKGTSREGEEEEEEGEEGQGGGEEGQGGGEERETDSFNLAAPALAHAFYNAVAYLVVAAG